MQIKTRLLLFSFQEMDGKVIFFDGCRDRWAQARFLQSPVPHHSLSQAIHCDPHAEPPWAMSGTRATLPSSKLPLHLVFWLFFFFFTSKHVATATPAFYRRSGEYSSRVQLLHGNTSQQPLFPSLLGEGEADPTVPCSLDHGVHTSWAKTGGWPVLWRDPLGLEEHPKNPLQWPALRSWPLQRSCDAHWPKNTACAEVGVPRWHPVSIVGGIPLEIILRFAEIVIVGP